MEVFEVRTTDKMRGDYGQIILEGILSDLPADGTVCIARTGPYIPSAAVMDGHLLLPERELSIFRGTWGACFVVKEVQVTKLVRFEYTLDELSRISDMMPGEPESIIIEGQHDEDLLQSMEKIYSVMPIESVKYTTFEYNRSAKRFAVFGGNSIDSPLYHARFTGGERLYCSPAFREWVLQKSTWAPFLRFTPVDFMRGEH